MSSDILLTYIPPLYTKTAIIYPTSSHTCSGASDGSEKGLHYTVMSKPMTTCTLKLYNIPYICNVPTSVSYSAPRHNFPQIFFVNLCTWVEQINLQSAKKR